MSNLDTQLKTFLRVAQLGSFRRAADEMFVTQAAVTSRIKALEAWLGFSVFQRHRRGADLYAISGAILIIGSGVYIIHREAVSRAKTEKLERQVS
jgi:hypothetical protein